ncbi:MAG: RES family NAD+ phosphorylase [Bacteroides cellulosilyticus]|nr:RES family NAD+ phosphorylase [Bacteroides cellulosilyticus]
MKTDELYEKVNALLPIIRSTNHENFKQDLQEALASYLDLVEDLDESMFMTANDKKECLSKIKSQTTTINNIIKLYFQGRQSEAYEVFQTKLNEKNFFFNNLSYKKITPQTQQKDTIFFRARTFENKQNRTRLDMFHIPFDQRHIIRTQRYSKPGYPCLYLGTTVYVCWKELQPCHFDDLMISGFKVAEEFRVYDLTVPKLEDYIPRKIGKTLLRLPLIIACQIKVKQDNAAFKPEYIIPQMLIEMIICNNRNELENGKNKTDLIWGILYSSTHKDRDFPDGRKHLENIAIPVIESDKVAGYCDVLASLFHISAPLCYQSESLKMNVNLTPQTSEIQKHIKCMETKIREVETYQQLPYTYANNPHITIPPEGGSVPVSIKSNTSWEIY